MGKLSITRRGRIFLKPQAQGWAGRRLHQVGRVLQAFTQPPCPSHLALGLDAQASGTCSFSALPSTLATRLPFPRGLAVSLGIKDLVWSAPPLSYQGGTRRAAGKGR